jgi:hypothetical protein
MKGQAALIAAGRAELRRGRPAKNARDRAITQAEAARRLDVSRTDVQAGKAVLASRDAGLIAMVRDGQVSVSAAAAVARLPEAERAAAVAGGAKAVKAKAAEAAADKKTRRRDSGTEDDANRRPIGPPAEGTDAAIAEAGPDEPEAGAQTADTPPAAGRDPRSHRLRARLGDPTFFDLEFLGYRANVDRRARAGGPLADEDLHRIVLAVSTNRRVPLSTRWDLLPPPEEWPLCGSCRGAGAVDGAYCLECAGAGFESGADPMRVIELAEERERTGCCGTTARTKSRPRGGVAARPGTARGGGHTPEGP